MFALFANLCSSPSLRSTRELNDVTRLIVGCIYTNKRENCQMVQLWSDGLRLFTFGACQVSLGPSLDFDGGRELIVALGTM